MTRSFKTRKNLPGPLKKIQILGFGGHASVVWDACVVMGFKAADFFVEEGLSSVSPAPGAKVTTLRRGEKFHCKLNLNLKVALAIGDNQARLWWCRKLLGEGFSLPPILHPRAWVSPSAVLADGVFVGAGAVIQAHAKLGQAVLVNTHAAVEHHVEVGPGAHIGPGAIVAGHARIGGKSLVGAGAVIRDGVQVGAGAVVGAGAAVVGKVAAGITVVGVPARSRNKPERASPRVRR